LAVGRRVARQPTSVDDPASSPTVIAVDGASPYRALADLIPDRASVERVFMFIPE
jgi:hypothetical protein